MSGSFRKWRERLGATQLDVARIAGLSQTEISQIERAQRFASKLRAALVEMEERRRRQIMHDEKMAELERIWSESGESAAAQRAKAVMLNLAWKLLEQGDTDLADELLEALPSADATRLLEEFFVEDFGEEDGDE